LGDGAIGADEQIVRFYRYIFEAPTIEITDNLLNLRVTGGIGGGKLRRREALTVESIVGVVDVLDIA
jgi:hypothetical protein